LVGKTGGQTPLGRPRHRWEDNIRIDLREIVWESEDWVHLAQGEDLWWALLNTIINLWIP